MNDEIKFRSFMKVETDTLVKMAEKINKLEDELTKAKGEKTWGCGHTNHGSCSQCLGHVTNERNALRSELTLATEVVWHARKILETASFEDQLALKWSLSNALRAHDAALGNRDK